MPHKKIDLERDIFMPKYMKGIFIDMLRRSLLKKIICTVYGIRFWSVKILPPSVSNIIMQNNRVQTSTTFPQVLLLPCHLVNIKLKRRLNLTFKVTFSIHESHQNKKKLPSPKYRQCNYLQLYQHYNHYLLKYTTMPNPSHCQRKQKGYPS